MQLHVYQGFNQSYLDSKTHIHKADIKGSKNNLSINVYYFIWLNCRPTNDIIYTKGVGKRVKPHKNPIDKSSSLMIEDYSGIDLEKLSMYLQQEFNYNHWKLSMDDWEQVLKYITYL